MGEKISAFPVMTNPPYDAELVVALTGRNYKVPIGSIPSDIFLSLFSGGIYKNDFWNITTFQYPWVYQTTPGGTLTVRTTVANHPGIVRIAQNGAGTGIAFHLLGSQNVILIEGNEVTDLIFQIVTTTNLTFYFGFGDDFTNAAGGPFVDGVFFNISGTVLDGRTRNNSVGSTTGTTYAVTTATWYHLRIVVNPTATRVDFYVLDSNGAQLWTDFLTTNIPTTRVTGHGLRATKSTAGVLGLVDLDYMTLVLGKELTR